MERDRFRAPVARPQVVKARCVLPPATQGVVGGDPVHSGSVCHVHTSRNRPVVTAGHSGKPITACRAKRGLAPVRIRTTPTRFRCMPAAARIGFESVPARQDRLGGTVLSHILRYLPQ
jgi:hypothetical protein